MQSFFLRHRRSLILGILGLVMVTLLFAPTQSKNLRGSTYGRAPNGYGAWYAYMTERGTPIQRWQKPLALFLEDHPGGDRPVTLLQVGGTPAWLADRNSEQLQAWIAQGNRLVVLSSQGKITAAPFSSTLATPVGNLKIETRRRHRLENEGENSDPGTVPDGIEARRRLLRISPAIALSPRTSANLASASREANLSQANEPAPVEPAAETALLQDEFGTLVWATAEGKGSSVAGVTPYLAANAYQNLSGNFAFLAGLVNANEAELWVNEYSHGYRDRDQRTPDSEARWGDYFLRTPLLLIWVQGLVFLLIVTVALNRRWGLRRSLLPPKQNNSDAYITALSGVLRRSGNHDFVLRQWQTAERQRLQQQLGLVSQPLPLAELCLSWEQQTGQSSRLLKQLFDETSAPRTNAEGLRHWLKLLQELHRSGL